MEIIIEQKINMINNWYMQNCMTTKMFVNFEDFSIGIGFYDSCERSLTVYRDYNHDTFSLLSFVDHYYDGLGD